MFRTKQQIVLHLTRDAIVAHTGKSEHAKLEFPTSVIRNLEVLDAAKLSELVAVFADEQGLKGRKVVIVLDDSIVFQKVVALAQDSDVAAIETDFQEKIPLPQDSLRVLSLKLKDQLVLLGANSSYYLQVVQALANKGAKIVSVTPLAVFIKGAAKLTADLVARILQNHHLADAANFLNLERKK